MGCDVGSRVANFKAMVTVRRIRAVIFAVLLGLLLSRSGSSAAASASLSDDELSRLARGDTITRTQTIERGSGRYIGGVTYTVVAARPGDILAVLEDVGAYRQVLPRTKNARLVGRNGGEFFVELRQGNALVDATYTIRVRRSDREVRFWLDPTKPHGIDDAWGFFRAEPLADGPRSRPRTLVTYGVLVDVGSGIVRELFEEKVRGLLLSVPSGVQRYLAEKSQMAAVASSR